MKNFDKFEKTHDLLDKYIDPRDCLFVKEDDEGALNTDIEGGLEQAKLIKPI